MLLIVLVVAVLPLSLKAQATGLWEVTKVIVGQEEMTPVAKWTQINKDGTFETGNGWLQNGNGTWTFD